MIKTEKALKSHLINLLELETQENDVICRYLLNHSVSYFFTHYPVLRLSESTNQKIEALKLIVNER